MIAAVIAAGVIIIIIVAFLVGHKLFGSKSNDESSVISVNANITSSSLSASSEQDSNNNVSDSQDTVETGNSADVNSNPVESTEDVSSAIVEEDSFRS